MEGKLHTPTTIHILFFFSIASEIQEINIGIFDIKICSGAESYIKRVLTKSVVTEPLIGSEGFLLLEQSECFATPKEKKSYS